MIKAILFDLDGVLVDAPDLHYNALQRALGLFGYQIPYDEHLARYNGLPTRLKLEMLGVPKSLRPFIAEMKQTYTRELIKTTIFPDYQKSTLLNSLKNKYMLGCVSNATIGNTTNLLVAGGLDSDDRYSGLILGYFSTIVSADDVEHPKPHPEPYLLAMKRLSVLPDECVIVEDSPVGVRSAVASGARVIQVNNAKEVHSGLFIRNGLL